MTPWRTVRCRGRSTDTWLDKDCRLVKRFVRRLVRAAQKADPAAAPAVVTAWKTRRPAYRDLSRQKRESFGIRKVDSERSNPRRLWQSVDVLMGRGHAPPSTDISASDFQHFSTTKSPAFVLRRLVQRVRPTHRHRLAVACHASATSLPPSVICPTNSHRPIH